jgi:hypothetical protein
MAEPDIAFAALDRDSGERFQSLRGQLDVRSFGMNLIVLQPRQRGRIHAHGQRFANARARKMHALGSLYAQPMHIVQRGLSDPSYERSRAKAAADSGGHVSDPNVAAARRRHSGHPRVVFT